MKHLWWILPVALGAFCIYGMRSIGRVLEREAIAEAEMDDWANGRYIG